MASPSPKKTIGVRVESRERWRTGTDEEEAAQGGLVSQFVQDSGAAAAQSIADPSALAQKYNVSPPRDQPQQQQQQHQQQHVWLHLLALLAADK